ncbi:histidine phosphatase family protein [Phaeobacter sp. PT47_59]|uniref:histidine phosphatase family protein n=1 Tax=Phaeobacter sp. PT47_59 TaxID=3029979 RepID=UPI0023800E54|nr:histidine phosphatase family protein [Phaeobacter sp. PT47_59]MDE4173656.1 histidine phosphatase family protein [Phaeobacter sp. PT47_59]
MSDYPKIWLLRHGETEWNAERRVQGQLESRLSERGIGHARRQAEIMAPILTAENPPCFVSPLGRAQQTAEIALAARRFETDARLAEVHAGDFQGHRLADLKEADPGYFERNSTPMDMFCEAPGGEGYGPFYARTLAFLETLSGPSVVVAHGLLGQVMRGIVCGLDRPALAQLENGQGCVYVLERGVETVLR